MSFTFAMWYRPAYQRRYGECKICHQGIEAGSQVMVGTGYFHHHIFKTHSHYECWIKEAVTYAKMWYFANKYKPTGMSLEIKIELNRLRAKRYYIKKNGGEPNEIAEKLAVVEKEIALVKARSKSE